MNGAAADQAKVEAEAPLGLYVHVPFCATTCDFCAFYQVPPTAEAVRGFLDAMAEEARLVAWSAPIGTIFWGGGTPGLLAPGALERLAEVVRSVAGDGPSEWSVELAPGSVTAERLGVLKAAGVTRVSLGAQSFSAERLEALGRRHSPRQVFQAYERIRSAGFSSVNLDLMFALPGQDEEAWEADLESALALGPDHLSTYCLTLEEDTALWVRMAKGRVRPDAGREARLYRRTWERLAEAGYLQYEVSNFARPGHACRHNLNTWRMGEWIGLGPAAASQHAGWRGANVADLDRWRSDLARGRRMTGERTRLTPALLAEDAVIFGLRMNEGVDLGSLRRRCPGAPWERIEGLLDRLESEELLLRAEDRARLTDRGRLVADAIGGEFIGLAAEAVPGGR